MTPLYWIGLVLAGALAGYLLVALIWPEHF